MSKWETNFEFVYNFKETPISRIDEKLAEYLRQKGIIGEKEEIEKIWISTKTELRYEKDVGGFAYECGGICVEYKPYTATIYTIRIRTQSKEIKMLIDDGDYYVEISSVKEIKKKAQQKAQK